MKYRHTLQKTLDNKEQFQYTKRHRRGDMMNKREKTMLYAILVLFMIVSVKSLLLDEVKNLTDDEQKIKGFVEEAIEKEERYNGFLQEMHLANYRIVSIKKTDEEGSFPIVYYDEAQKKKIQENIAGKYVIKVRGYFLHVLPYKEFRIKGTT